MISDLFFSGLGFAACAIIWIATAALRAAGREDAAELEAKETYDHGQPGATQPDAPAYTDDDYPAQPQIGPAAGPPAPGPDPEDGSAGGDGFPLPVDPADRPDDSERTYHALAVDTEGETPEEEIGRLEGRLGQLYDHLASETEALIADDVARVQQVLDLGLYALTDWLPKSAPRADPYLVAAMALAQ